MFSLEQISKLTTKNANRIILLIIDGLGGLPHPKTKKTELQTARIPNLNKLAKLGICGVHIPVDIGITPGSGPGHLSLFGYDPLKFELGRGVLEALGIDFDLQPTDIAARGNFCTVDDNNLIVDRRAGRISTETCSSLCQLLSTIKIEGVQLFIKPVKEHRFLLVMRGHNLSPKLSDTDPQKVGTQALECKPLDKEANDTSLIVNKFVENAKSLLADSFPANMLVLRGFSKVPSIPKLQDIYKLNPAAIASYPMYRGLAKLLGMKLLDNFTDLNMMLDILKRNYDSYDFFFLHYKDTDRFGEDGNFHRKVKALEEIDKIVPTILRLNPSVFIVTGDHSTPSVLKGHSWHPVPFVLYSKFAGSDSTQKFTEIDCNHGSLGVFSSQKIMLLALANSLKINKYGA